MTLVLASSSPARQRLLAGLGVEAVYHSPDIDESRLAGEQADDYVRRLAAAKADALRQRYPAHLLIGSDQACSLGTRIYGKPGDRKTATAQLKAFSGNWLTFHTAVALLDSRSGQCQQHLAHYRVKFRSLVDVEIDAYLERDQPWGCAGCFKAEQAGLSLFECMAGDDFSSLLGLPLIGLCRLLRQAGVDPLCPGPEAVQ